MRCRVWARPDGTLFIATPATRAQLRGEPDDVFYARVMAKTATAWNLHGLAFSDVDTRELPPPMTVVAGRSVPTRQAWRLKGGQVVIDPAALRPA